MHLGRRRTRTNSCQFLDVSKNPFRTSQFRGKSFRTSRTSNCFLCICCCGSHGAWPKKLKKHILGAFPGTPGDPKIDQQVAAGGGASNIFCAPGAQQCPGGLQALSLDPPGLSGERFFLRSVLIPCLCFLLCCCCVSLAFSSSS